MQQALTTAGFAADGRQPGEGEGDREAASLMALVLKTSKASWFEVQHALIQEGVDDWDAFQACLQAMPEGLSADERQGHITRLAYAFMNCPGPMGRGERERLLLSQFKGEDFKAACHGLAIGSLLPSEQGATSRFLERALGEQAAWFLRHFFGFQVSPLLVARCFFLHPGARPLLRTAGAGVTALMGLFVARAHQASPRTLALFISLAFIALAYQVFSILRLKIMQPSPQQIAFLRLQEVILAATALVGGYLLLPKGLLVAYLCALT